MPCTIEINDAGQSVLSIPDADGECRAYRWKIIPPGFSLWALSLVRCDSEAAYRVALEAPGRWTCNCPAQTYRKRGSPACKHIDCARALRGWLMTFVEEMDDERIRNAV